MRAISIDEIIILYETCINGINNVFDGNDMLNSDTKIEIRESGHENKKTKSLVKDSMEKTKKLLILALKEILSTKDLNRFESIKKTEKEIEEIYEMNRSQELKNKWIKRRKNKIENLKKELEMSLSADTRLKIERLIYKTEALFKAKIAWIYNQRAHKDNKSRESAFSEKDVNMQEIIAKALLSEEQGGILRNIPNTVQEEVKNLLGENSIMIRKADIDNRRCLYILFSNIPISNVNQQIALHFGTENNYKSIMKNADKIINNEISTRPDIAFRAKLKLRYLNRESMKSQDDKSTLMPIKGGDREQIELYVIKYLYYKELINSRSRENNNDREELTGKMNECKSILLRVCISNPEASDSIIDIIRKTPTIDKDEDNEREGLYEDLMDSIEIKKRLTHINSNKGLIDFLKKNIDCIDNIQQVNSIINGKIEFSNLLEMIQKIQKEKDANNKKEMAEMLIYRCVGKGTEGEDAFFPSTDEDSDSRKQIIDFIKTLDLDIADYDVEYSVDEAIKDKTSIKDNPDGDWTEDFKNIEEGNKSNIILFLKNEMIKYKMDLSDMEDAVKILRTLELLYGKVEDGVVDDISMVIKTAFSGNIENITQDKKFIIEQFEDITLENNYTAFFDLIERLIE